MGDGGLGFDAGLLDVSALLADLREAGVARRRSGSAAIAAVELLFGFGQEALGEVVATVLGVLGGLLLGWQGGDAEGADLVELVGGLAEAGLGVGAAEACGGLKAVDLRAAGGDDGAELLGFGVGGV